MPQMGIGRTVDHLGELPVLYTRARRSSSSKLECLVYSYVILFAPVRVPSIGSRRFDTAGRERLDCHSADAGDEFHALRPPAFVG